MRIGALAWLGAALAAATLACAGREPARAEGAIAVGTTGDVVRYGIAFGYAVDMAQGKAGEIAVERCRTFKAREAAERCQVVATFGRECFAIAYDPKSGTPGAGWGIGPDQLVANQKAVAMCEQAAGPARKGYCQVERFGCDTTGPKTAPKPDAKPDAPGSDTKAGPDAKGAKDAKAVKDAGADAVPEDPPPPAPRPAAGPKKTAPGPPEARGRGPAGPLLPVLALVGVGAAYALGQRLRGRLGGALGERQILMGGALAVAAAIAVKLLDMAGAAPAAAAAVAGLIALGAALLA